MNANHDRKFYYKVIDLNQTLDTSQKLLCSCTPTLLYTTTLLDIAKTKPIRETFHVTLKNASTVDQSSSGPTGPTH